MVFKCLKGLAAPFLARRFTPRSQTHYTVTRQMDELGIPSYRTAAGKRSFLYRATKLWNDLDTNIKNSSCIGVFKKTGKKESAGRVVEQFEIIYILEF